jgi:hypothetical protein
MSFRYALAAAIVFTGLSSAAYALPMDQFQLPSDTSKPKDSSDGLFNHSIPDHWDNSSSQHEDESTPGKLHFSMTSSSDNMVPRSSYGDAKTPMSEFYQPTPPANDDPLLDH